MVITAIPPSDYFTALFRAHSPQILNNAMVSNVLFILFLYRIVEYFSKGDFVSKVFVNYILHLVHNCNISVHCSSRKKLSRLDHLQWKGKALDVRLYCEGCVTYQQEKDRCWRPLGILQVLEFPKRRWGSVSLDFITHLPETARGYD